MGRHGITSDELANEHRRSYEGCDSAGLREMSDRHFGTGRNYRWRVAAGSAHPGVRQCRVWQEARRAKVVVAPTLVQQSPMPVRLFVGDMIDEAKILRGLNIKN